MLVIIQHPVFQTKDHYSFEAMKGRAGVYRSDLVGERLPSAWYIVSNGKDVIFAVSEYGEIRALTDISYKQFSRTSNVSLTFREV